MANSNVEYIANGSTNQFDITFSYIDRTHIKVFVDNVEDTTFTFINDNRIQTTSMPANTAVVKLDRQTPISSRLVDFQDGSVLTEADLDKSADQNFFIAQETEDEVASKLGQNNAGVYDALNKRIINLANPTSAQDAATKDYLESTWLSATDKATITNLNSNISDVNAVNSNATNINTVAGSNTNINTVATNIASVNTVATNITDVVAVANDLAEAVSEVETVANDLNEATSEIDTVATNITNVNTVGNNIANVNTVAGSNSDINTVAANNTNINTVAGISSQVSSVAGISSDVSSIAAISTDVSSLANSLEKTYVVTVVGGVFYLDGVSNPAIEMFRGNKYIFNLSDSSNSGHPLAFKDGSGNSFTTGVTTSGTAGTSGATVTFEVPSTAPNSMRYYCTVHGNGMGNTITVTDSNLSLVATNIANVNSVAGNESNINAAVSNASNINSAVSNSTNINSVASNISNVNSVAGNETNINTVAGADTNISTVAGAISNINSVASNATNINAVNSNSSNINTVAGATTNINTVASNLTNVNNFADTYFVSANAPSSPTVGDLWFDTTNNIMKVYGSGGFANAGSSVNGTSERFKYTATANQTTFSGSDDNSNTLNYDAGFVDVFLNGVKLISGTDFTATSGTSIVLASAAAANDILAITTYGTFQLSNFSINAANDVSTSGVSNGQVLAYNSSASAFQPTTVDLTNLSASNLTSGTLPDARFPATLPASNGSALTNLTSANLTGALPAIDGSALTGISAGSVNLTAGADVTLGDVVEVTATGTVRPVLNDGPLVSNEATVSSSLAQFGPKVVVLEDNKYFAVFSDNGSTIIKGVIITNSNGTISVGTPVTVKNTSTTDGDKIELITLSSSLVVMGDVQTNGNVTFTAISISGSTISAGTPVAGYSGGNGNTYDICELDSSKFFFAQTEALGTNASPKCRVGSVSGTSISFGTEYDTGTYQQYSHAGNIKLIPIDSTHVFFAWCRWASYSAWGSFMTISGTSISAQTTLSQLSSASSHFFLNGFKLDNDYIAVGIRSDILKFFLIPIDYTTGATVTQTISFAGERIDINDFGGGVDSNGKITFGGKSMHSTSNGTLRMGTVSYDPTAGTQRLIANPMLEVSSSVFERAGADALDGTGITVARDDVNQSVKAFSFNPSLIETVNRFIGVAGETFTNTNNGKVVHTGGVVEGLSGLTIGKNYYVNLSTGALTTIKNDFPVGKAISASKLLITHTGVLN